MGIPGLLRVLKSVVRPTHVKAYAGKKVAIDAYSWLHKGTYSCAKELCLGTPTDKYVQYCMHMVRMLKHHGVHPVLIFDGARLPSKSGKESERKQSRREKMERGLEHLRSGNERAAYECFQKAVDVTPTMAWHVAQACKEEGGVECMVAPYEADAQMAFLARTGYVHAVISEDSDLIPYGCPRMLYKMDKYGSGEELLWSELSRTPDVDWFGFNSDMIILTCVISGCDYLDGVHGIGVKKASRLVKDVRTPERVLRALRLDSKVDLPGDYEDQFYRAILTFRYHYVYDPVEKEMVHLSPLAEMDAAGRDLSFLGEVIGDKATLIGVCAECALDPMTKTPFSSQEKSPRKKQSSIKSFGSKRDEKVPVERVPPVQLQKKGREDYAVKMKELFRSRTAAPRPTESSSSFKCARGFGGPSLTTRKSDRKSSLHYLESFLFNRVSPSVVEAKSSEENLISVSGGSPGLSASGSSRAASSPGSESKPLETSENAEKSSKRSVSMNGFYDAADDEKSAVIEDEEERAEYESDIVDEVGGDGIATMDVDARDPSPILTGDVTQESATQRRLRKSYADMSSEEIAEELGVVRRRRKMELANGMMDEEVNSLRGEITDIVESISKLRRTIRVACAHVQTS